VHERVADCDFGKIICQCYDHHDGEYEGSLAPVKAQLAALIVPRRTMCVPSSGIRLNKNGILESGKRQFAGARPHAYKSKSSSV
jgi:hypothetical protein